MEAAGLPYQDDEGKCFDFHALRGETASLLAAAGVPINDVKDVLRHSTIRLTADVYAKTLEAGHKARAITALPDLSLPQSQAAAATDTDGREILRDCYSPGGSKRTGTEASGSSIASSASEPAILGNGDGYYQVYKPVVVGSNPTVGFVGFTQRRKGRRVMAGPRN